MARSKAARACSTDKGRISYDDSADSPDPDRPVPETSESKVPAPVMKKAAIILPILGKHHKEAMLRAAAAKEEKEKAAAAAAASAQLASRPLPVIRPATPDTAGKRRRPGRPKKASTSQSQG